MAYFGACIETEYVKSYWAIVTKYVKSQMKDAYEKVLQRFSSEKFAKRRRWKRNIQRC